MTRPILSAIVGPPYWGVDCVAPAHKPFGDEPTLYDYVVKQSNGRLPAYFGRYLTPAEYQKVTQPEVEFLSSRGCRILLNYNQFGASAVATKGQAGRDNARAHAAMAANFARGIGVPSIRISPAVFLYANIDSGFKPSSDWIAAWWDGLWDEGFGPGLYFPAAGSTTIANAVAKCNIPEAQYWISIWSWSGQSQKGKNTSASDFLAVPPVFLPWAVDIWQYSTKCFAYGGDDNKSFDMNLATQVGYEIMWKV